MNIEFEKEFLRELYENGKSSNKKYRFQPPLIKKYKNTVDKLKASNRIEDLFPFVSLNYEKLSGDKKDIESVRIDDKYRLEFISRIEEDGINKITICSLIDISNHYH
jgi:proteic killer suppression protein